jgi:hypothetical protein
VHWSDPVQFLNWMGGSSGQPVGGCVGASVGGFVGALVGGFVGALVMRRFCNLRRDVRSALRSGRLCLRLKDAETLQGNDTSSKNRNMRQPEMMLIFSGHVCALILTMRLCQDLEHGCA